MDPLEETLGPEVNSEYLIEDGVPDYPGGARPKQYSNVIVDDSPLQNQMQKNKECKFSDENPVKNVIVTFVWFLSWYCTAIKNAMH